MLIKRCFHYSIFILARPSAPNNNIKNPLSEPLRMMIVPPDGRQSSFIPSIHQSNACRR